MDDKEDNRYGVEFPRGTGLLRNHVFLSAIFLTSGALSISYEIRKPMKMVMMILLMNLFLI
jgi:hypothetical protein